MHIKGTEKFREKLPLYSGRKIIIIPLIALLAGCLNLIFLVLMYVLPSLQPNNQFLMVIEPLLPIIGQIISITLGFIFISRVWSKRERLLSESRETAYQKGITIGFIGISTVIVTVLHRLVPIEITWEPLNPFTQELASPLFFGNQLLSTLALIFGVIIILIGFFIAIRTLAVFGIDYMALLYLYYPEESELKENQIYSIVRHPTYFAVMLIALGGWIGYLSVYAFTSFILFVVGINIHLKFVEEKELIERFGQGYLDYKKKVPIIVNPLKIPMLFKFILFG
ncbi:MAG: methyltransferase family protein [Candidatus Hodarchaeales archaeon]